MICRNFSYIAILVFLMSISLASIAGSHMVSFLSGDIHLKGALTEGACVASTESRDMYIDMGNYSSAEFDGVGSESSLHIPFTVHLSDCDPALAKQLTIAFLGMTDPKEPDAFRVTSGYGAPSGISGNAGFSGLGLIISNSSGRQVIPSLVSGFPFYIDGREVLIPYAAHYRATSKMTYPGVLRSEVWFQIAYP